MGGAQAAAGRSNGPASAREAVIADEHGRDNVGEIELALDKDNKFIGAARCDMLANIGAYVGSDRNLLVAVRQ